MRLRPIATAFGLSLLISAAPASAEFSIDAASPDVPAVGQGDGLVLGPPIGPPPFVVTPSATFGLVLGEELDAFSSGFDTICPAGNPNCFTIITYSVDRLAVGAVPPVTTEVGGNGAAGDIFTFEVTGTGVVLTPPSLSTDAPANDLTLVPESNLDALNSTGFIPPFYFSINLAAVPGASVRWAMAGLTASDILVAPGPIPAIYATAAALGLLPGDDIDAVSIMDSAPAGVLSAADVVHVSLAPGSPTLVALAAAPGDIIQVSPGAPVVIYPAALMALAGTDNIDALSMIDPPIAPVPSLGSRGIALLFLGLGTVVLLGIRRGTSS